MIIQQTIQFYTEVTLPQAADKIPIIASYLPGAENTVTSASCRHITTVHSVHDMADDGIIMCWRTPSSSWYTATLKIVANTGQDLRRLQVHGAKSFMRQHLRRLSPQITCRWERWQASRTSASRMARCRRQPGGCPHR